MAIMEKNYVSLETAKLLKEKGFKEWCSHCYGIAVLHNGKHISFDEECELKDEGRENEIEYVEGGMLYDSGYNNRDKDEKAWAAPTLWDAMKWLRKEHNLIIVPNIRVDDQTSSIINCYIVGIWYVPKNNGGAFCYTSPTPYNGYPSYEEACESAIKYCLENLI